MSILVSGGTGYIGSHACVELLEAGYDIIVVDNLSNSSPESLRRVEQITGKTVPFIEADLCDTAATEAIFAQYPDITAVMHFAGLKAVGESVRKPLEYYTNNLVSTLVLLNVMRDHGVKNFIFSSSATVYGDPASVPIREDFPTGGTTNPYGTLEQNLTIRQICQDNLIGRAQLENYFHRQTGGGVIDYFGKLKIDAARRMIREGRLNITQIASQLGFSSVHYFSRRFKSLTGMSPSEYAKSVKMLSESFPKESDDRANNI